MANARTIEFILKAIGDFGDVKGNIDTIQKSLNQLKLNPQLKQNFSNIFADLQKQTAKYQDYLNSGFKTKGDVTGLEKTGNKINALLNQLQTNMNKIDPSVLKESFEIDTTQFEELNKQIKEAQSSIEQITSSDNFKVLTGQVNGVVKEFNKLTKSKALTQFQESFEKGNIDQAREALEKLSENANRFKDNEEKLKAYNAKISELGTLLGKLEDVDGLQKANDDLKNFSSQLESLGAKQLEELLNAFAQGKIDVQNFVNAVRGYSSATNEAAKKTFEFGSEIDHFKNRAAYFLGLTNSINLFKRALQKALETVKELDAVMTETAVVTDFTVGDMWEKLPEYAAHAKALGSSIKDVYAATTLYYQQGLKTNEAMSVGVETMKMARIANLDAGDATQYMTAALRGFNMEVNELNAQRVNDVYSELAAITAADTSQIATAMSKTASIASAANMEFETTAALLAQIIETTQEAPETAGTALKTIIARFSEVKKLREEGQMTGKDEEGEEIDVNKIQAALRTVNISMNDFFAGTEGLDSILLKLAEKWGSLDFETQRYIATMAAGSRQQSRFIAMMSDYERTMELATAANNSAGASQQQFDKTLDSMEAKLAKLTTAWQEFTMGLANDEILKGAVDALTFILNTINKVIDVLSGSNGIAKAVITLNIAITAIGGLRSALEKLFNSSLIGTVQKAFKTVKNESLTTGVTAGKNIATGIENELNSLVAKGTVIGTELGQNLAAGTQAGFSGKSIITPSQGENSENPPKDSSKTRTATTSTGTTLSLLSKPEQPSQPDSIPNTGETEEIIKEQSAWSKAMQSSSVQGLRLTGVLTSLTGTALNWLGAAELSKNETSELGAGLKAAGTTASIAGSALSLLAPILSKLTISVGTLLPWLAAAVVGIGLVFTVAQSIKNTSPEGQLEAAKKAAEEASQAAEDAAEQYERLASSLDEIKEKENNLEGLATNTREWKAAVTELNNEILDLIELYPKLGKFIISENGILGLSSESIDGETVESILNDYQEAEIKAQSAKAASLIDVQKKQQVVNLDNLDNEYKFIIEPENKQTQIEDFGVSDTWIQAQQMDYLSPTTEQAPEISYDEESTIELAKAIASGSWKGKEAQIEEIGGVGSETFNALKEFGQSLIISEAAIEAYSQSILNNAIINSDIAEEQKNQLQGFMSSEDTYKMLETEKQNLSNVASEDIKKQFAEAMNYMYDESSGKMYSGYGEDRKEVIMNDEEIRSQLAAIKIQNQLTQKTEALSKKIGTLTKNGGELGKTFVNMISKADGAGFTLEDISNLKGKFDKTYEESANIVEGEFQGFNDEELQNLYSQVKDIYSPEQFFKIFSDSYSQAAERAAQSQKTLSSIGVSDLFTKAKIDTGALFDISNSLYDVFLKTGSEKTRELATQLNDITSTLAPEQAQIFAEALNSLDWSNTDSVEELDSILAGMNFTGQIGDIEALEDQIKEAAKAGRDFNLSKLREGLKSTQELINDLKDREETDRTFTEEEKKQLVEANPALANQFVMTGIDEFIYVGNSIDTLIKALKENTAAILKEENQNLKDKADKSQLWKDLMNDSSTTYQRDAITRVPGGSQKKTHYDTFADIVNGVLSDDIRYSNYDSLYAVLETLGENTDGEIEELKARIEQLFGEDYGENGIKADENIQRYETYKVEDAGMTYQYQNKTNYDLLQDATTQGGENQQYAIDQILVEASAYSEVSDELVAYNALLDKNDELKEGFTEAEQDAALKTLKFATDLAKAKKEMNSYGEAADEVFDELENLEEGTEAYKDELDELAKQTNKYLDSNIDDEFLEQGNNLDLLESALEGNADAWEQFNRNIINATQESMIANNQMAKDFAANAENIANITSALDALEFDVNGTADVTQLINEFLAAGGTASEVAAYLEQLGLTNIDLIADVEGVDTLQQAIEAGGGTRVLGTVKATNVRLAPSSFSGFTGGGGRKSSGGGGGGGGGGSKTKWENPYDEFYNTVELLNEELRKREQLERRYQRLLDKTNTKASDLVSNIRDQLDSFEVELKTRQGLLAGRERQMADIESENSKYSKYASYNEKLGVIEIDWEKIQSLEGSTNEKFTQGLEDYIGKLEEQQKLIEEEQDAIAEIEDAIKEIRDQGKDEYFNLESQIKEALQHARQDEIDKLSAINESINDSNSRLIDAMQSSIDKYRQDRENEKTEEELSDKQRRLAYLQQDTSGANALEIMQLQKEIEEGQEDYTDTLIDQKINELQEQNDEAAEQRQQQIDLLQSQLDHYLNSQEVWEDVYSLMSNGIGPDGIIAGSELESLLQESANFEGMSYLEKMKWLEDLENNVAKAVQWLIEGNSTEALISSGELKSGQKISFTTADGKKVAGTLDSKGNVTTDSGEVYENVYRTYNGAFVTDENYITPEPPKSVETTPESQQTAKAPELTKEIKKGVAKAIINGNYGWGVGRERVNKLVEVFGANDIQRNYVDKGIYSGNAAEYSYTKMRKKFKQYKTGGLADFTGPAWLDGTKSKPEYILNADQTKAFFSLVDILEGLRAGGGQSSQISGDSIYDIDINVESIGNDYDVEQMASTIKRMINDDARYRNNNVINLSR